MIRHTFHSVECESISLKGFGDRREGIGAICLWRDNNYVAGTYVGHYRALENKEVSE